MGYEYELRYFIDCIAQQRKPAIVTLRDAATSVAIIEAEARSARTGEPQTVQP
jgi:predicted dehydrogenase